jgi:hypothetical protein
MPDTFNNLPKGANSITALGLDNILFINSFAIHIGISILLLVIGLVLYFKRKKGGFWRYVLLPIVSTIFLLYFGLNFNKS